jgi:hypothetical protein
MIASQSFAATLYYDQATGVATIDPTDKGATPTGKVFAYNLASNNAFAADASRMSVFPPPAPTFFESSPSVIADNDLSLQGTAAVINLGNLFTDDPINQGALEAKFTNRIYVAGLGGGELQLPLVFIPVPEPATAGLAGLCMLGLAFRRRLVG